MLHFKGLFCEDRILRAARLVLWLPSPPCSRPLPPLRRQPRVLAQGRGRGRGRVCAGHQGARGSSFPHSAPPAPAGPAGLRAPNVSAGRIPSRPRPRPGLLCLPSLTRGFWTEVWLSDLGVSSQKCPNLGGRGAVSALKPRSGPLGFQAQPGVRGRWPCQVIAFRGPWLRAAARIIGDVVRWPSRSSVPCVTP